ncbi:MAG: thiamine phosphate synthase [Verrucomicrobia bacterium]|nr:thiamine phosphate synthase [Verrucomicrobiota bacterium]
MSSVCKINLRFGLVAPIPQIQTKARTTSFVNLIEKALEGGISYIQLWGPNQVLQSSYSLVEKVNEIAALRNIPLIINNCADIALKANLAGVHLGQRDISYPIARQILGSAAIIGLTVNSWEDVVRAQTLDVTYLGVQVFPSKWTKPQQITDPQPWGIEGAKRVISCTRHPVVLIGNLTQENLNGIAQHLRPQDGIAMAGEIMRAADPAVKVREISRLIEELT